MNLKNLVAGAAVVAGAVSLTVAAVGSLLVLLPDNPLPKDERKPIFDIMPGDMIQWESMGAFIFQSPRKVDRVENTVHGMFVFVEDAGAGIPIEQCVKMS